MDWIERLFGISPDGGDGTTEMLYVVAAIAVAALVFGVCSTQSGFGDRATRAL
jgi:hypothetical protein